MVGRRRAREGRNRTATTIRRAHERRRLRLRRAAHRPSRLLRRPIRQHEDDRRARRRRSPLLARDQRGAVDGPVDDVDRHRDLRAPPRLPALGRRARPVDRDVVPRVLRARVRGRELRLRHELPLQGPARGERPRHERDARRRVRVAAREPRRAVLPLRPQLGDAHALRHPARRPQGLARGEDGDHRRHPVRLRVGARVDARVVPDGRRASVRGARRLVPRGARVARAAREHRLRVPLRPRRVVGRALRGEGRRQGRLPHARRDALRRDRRGAVDPLGPRTARAGRRRLAGAHGRSHADAARPRGTAGARDATASRCCDRRATGGGHRRHRHGRAHEARDPQAAVEADPRRRERGGGGVPARRSIRASCTAVRRTCRPSCARSSFASSRAPSATS